MFAEDLGVDHALVEVTTLNAFEQALHPINDLLTSAIAQGQDQGESRVLGSQLNGPVQLRLTALRQIMQTADGLQPDVLLLHLRRLLAEKQLQQFHQRIHLALRPLPVLRGKSIQGQKLHTQITTGLRHAPNRLSSLTVPLRARQATLFCPATIAIHDDGDVARDIFEIFSRWHGRI